MSAHVDIEEHFLPRDMRLDLCMGLLEQAGASKVKLVEHRGEINCCCIMPWHPETHPSASVNFDRLTYHCSGCSTSGGLYWLTQTILGGDYEAARNWLGTAGFGGGEDNLQSMLNFLDALDESYAKGTVRAPMPRYSEKVLEPWDQIYPGLTEGVPDLGIVGRGIPEENLRRAKVGWDMKKDRVTIPLWVDGALVGWQSRRIVDDGSAKYLNTPDFPRDKAILGLPTDRRRVIVVESPMSYLKHLHHAPVACTYGAGITPQQIGLLKWFDEVTFATDNDPAGWKAIEGWINDEGDYVPGAAFTLTAYTKVSCWEYDWYADAADFDDDTFEKIDAERVPFAIWTKPTGTLRCWRCKQPHTGECT